MNRGKLYCVFSSGSLSCLLQRMHNHIGCIGLAFPRCAFSSASSSFLFDTVHTCNGCICLSFSHCAFPNASSSFLDKKCKITLFAFVKIFSDVPLILNGMHARLLIHTVCICLTFLRYVF